MLPWLVVISDLRLDLNPMFPLNPQVIFRCLPFVKTKVPSTARLPVPLTQVPSKAARNQFLGNNRNVMKAKPLAASGVTPAGVSGWEPPAHSGETSGPLETTKPQDTATIGNVEPAGKLAVPRCHPPTTRVAGGANEDTIAKTPGRMATTRGPQGRRIGNDSRKDNAMEAMMSGAIGEVILNTKDPATEGRDSWGLWHDQPEVRNVPEADGRDGRSRWNDSPQDRGGSYGASLSHHRGKWEPRVDDLRGSKFDDEINQGWGGNGKEFFVDHGFGKSNNSGTGARASERLQVPTFSAEDSEDLGGSARSYLRQIEAWKRMTMLPANMPASPCTLSEPHWQSLDCS